MLYVTVIATLFFLTLKGYCGKRLSCFVRKTEDTCIFNTLRMVFCMLIGIALMLIEGSVSSLAIEPRMLGVCIFSGFSNVAFLIFWMLEIRRNSMVSVDVGLMLGALIPSVLCALLFAEEFSVPKMVGFAVMLSATVILSGTDDKRTKKSPLGILFLILAALGEGFANFSQQLYNHCYTESASAATTYYPKSVFHFYTYVFAAVFLILVVLVLRIYNKTKKYSEESETALENNSIFPPPRAVVHIFIMAVSLFVANYLQTYVTGDLGLSSQLLYPILKGGCLITVNIVAALFFDEKITRRTAIGSLVALAGIIVMSVL